MSACEREGSLRRLDSSKVMVGAAFVVVVVLMMGNMVCYRLKCVYFVSKNSCECVFFYSKRDQTSVLPAYIPSPLFPLPTLCPSHPRRSAPNRPPLASLCLHPIRRPPFVLPPHLSLAPTQPGTCNRKAAPPGSNAAKAPPSGVSPVPRRSLHVNVTT